MGERQLADHERAMPPRMPAAGHPRAVCEFGGHGWSRGAQCGHQREGERRGTGERQTEGEHGRIHRHLRETGHRRRRQGHDHVDAPGRQQQTHESPRQREGQRFAQQLPHQHAAVRAKRCAHGQFPAPRRDLAQQQVRDVGRGHEQQHDDRDLQQQEHGAHVAHDRGLQGLDVCAETRVGVGIRHRQPGHHRPQLACGTFRRHAGPQPTEDEEQVRIAHRGDVAGKRERARHTAVAVGPDLGRGLEREGERRRQHAYDRARPAIEDQRGAER